MSLTPQQKREKFRIIQYAVYGTLPLLMAVLAYMVEPFWLGLVIGGAIALTDVVTLQILKKRLGINTTLVSTPSEQQSQQL